MAQRGPKAVRALFVDGMDKLARETPTDPAARFARVVNGQEVIAGKWPGAPVDKMPPDCPVIPLGVDGDLSFFVDTLGQLRSFKKFQHDDLISLFARTPNYLEWAWPKWGSMTNEAGEKVPVPNGCEVRKAAACLMKAAAERGIFTAQDRVRGRGAWRAATGELVWHAGDVLVVARPGKLQFARPGSTIGDEFYPRRPPIVQPWAERVSVEESPAHDILAKLRTWTYERPRLDPVLIVGWIGAAFLGGALDWRPSLFLTGGHGRGKSTLQGVLKAVLGNALLATTDTTQAGIYQQVKQDSLPVSVDELEAGEDNRRVKKVVELARISASGGMMLRGGAEHEGVQFQARNTFAFSAINPPPLGPQDRSRMAIINLGKIEITPEKKEAAVLHDVEVFGPQLLRLLLDAWPQIPKAIADMKDVLGQGGLDSRAQDTYGTLLGLAAVLLGDEALEAAEIPITEAKALGELIAAETEAERSEQVDNWQRCLSWLMQSTIEAWKGGEKPTVGAALEALEREEHPQDSLDTPLDSTRRKLAAAGLGITSIAGEGAGAAGRRTRWALAIPVGDSPQLRDIFRGTEWGGGGWAGALKQAPTDIVLRGRAAPPVKINRMNTRCVLVDLEAYDRMERGEGT